jgi:hypothetical protein
LHNDEVVPQRRILPKKIKHKVAVVAFLVGGYSLERNIHLDHSPETWLQHRIKPAEILEIPFPAKPAERLFFKDSFEGRFIENWNYLVRAPNGGTYLAIFRNVIPADLVEHMDAVTTELLNQREPTQTHQSFRGDGKYYLFGYHCFSSPHVSIYKHMLEPCFIKFSNKLKPYFALFRAVIKKHCPGMLSLQSNSLGDEEVNPFFPFTAGQINANTLAQPHFDEKDLSGTLNVLTVVGQYSGGELLFSNLGVKIGINPGDIILFEGSRLKHEVLPIGSGSRRTSINMYVDSCAFLSHL